MTIKYTRTTLEKIHKVFNEMNYKVRYEKGSFQSGYCLVVSQNIAVINKFFDVKARINVLLDILSQIAIPMDQLSNESTSLLNGFGLGMFAGAEA